MDFSNVKNVTILEGDVDKIVVNGVEVWKKEEPEEYKGLCFTAEEANSTVELTITGSPSIANSAYSTDGSNWTTFTPSTTAGTNVVTLANVGDKVYFRNDITGNLSYSSYMHFKMSGKISASGNCNSMYSSTEFESLTELHYNYCYKDMFSDNSSLTTAPELPATTLSNSCYLRMFWACSKLTTAPALPAMTLSPFCYYSMFSSCTSLTTAPALPATTLANHCYGEMFSDCSSLTTAPALPATILADNCYYEMFYYCISLTTAPALPATKLKSSCYLFMFYACQNLYVSDTQTTEAPYAWRIPSSGTFTNTTQYDQTNMFISCLGTRASATMTGANGESHTYYTQNPPIE